MKEGGNCYNRWSAGPQGRGGGWSEGHREEGREGVSESARNGGSDE